MLPDALSIWVPGHPLSPNSRAHWRTKARDTKLFREAAWAAGRAASPPATPAQVHMHVRMVYPPRAPMHDLDNAAAMPKPAVDGLRDAGILLEDNPRAMLSYLITQERGPSRGMIFEVRTA